MSDVRVRAAVLRALPLALAVSAASAGAQEAQVEEVVVTGSYIKREAADSPNPLSVIDRATIDQLGAVTVNDVVNNMTFNSGSIGQTNAFSGGDSSTGNTNVNLRNLGAGSTLVLINGKRSVATNTDQSGNGYVDLGGIVPNIALERVEVVKDGSSALYGSDAVAGVVNFITRENFTGFEMQVDYQQDDESGEQEDRLYSAILGVDGDKGHITIAGSYLDRRPLQIVDRYDRFGQSGISTFGQPGRYVALGPITQTPSFFDPVGQTSFGQGADPDCNLAAAESLGTIGNVNGLCLYDFSPFFNLVGEEEQFKVHSTFNYAFNDQIELYGEAAFSDNTFTRGNSLFPDVTFAIVPPNSPGLQLDAARRGIAPVPYLALQRLLGGDPNTDFADRPIVTNTDTDRQFNRFMLGSRVDFDLGDNAWTADISLTRSERNLSSSTRSDTLTNLTNNAYAGFGGPSCNPLTGTAGSGNMGTGDCFFYNPFATSRFDPVTGARWNTSDTSPWAANPALTVQEAARLYQNPTELIQQLAGEIKNDTENTQTVVDAVFAGDLFDWDGGTVGLAVGFQYREDQVRTDLDKDSNNDNFKFVFGADDFTGELTTTAAFVELFVPFPGGLEMQLAARYEDFDEIDENTFDPKISLLWRPEMFNEDLTLRASAGTSFRVGSLLQLFGNQTSLLNSTDAFSGTGGLAFRPSITTGNNALTPEEAEAYNIGFSWQPSDGALDGLSVDFDYYVYQYEDIITREQHQDLINQDNASRCPNGPNQDPAAGPLCGAFDSNGDGLPEIFSIGPGLPDKVIRNAAGSLLRTQASYLNAQSLDSSGFDATIRYALATDSMGFWNFAFNASYTLEYDLVDPQGNSIDGVGSRNAGNSVGRSLPEYKLNAMAGWTMGRHNVNVMAFYIPEYDDDVPQSALRGSFIGLHPTIDDWTNVDIQYNFDMSDIMYNGDGSRLTLGLKNAFNEDPPFLNFDGAYDPFVHDPRGRLFFARYTLSI